MSYIKTVFLPFVNYISITQLKIGVVMDLQQILFE